MFQSPGPVALELGPFSIRWYGILIACGIALCYFYAVKEARRRGVAVQPIEDMAFWLVLCGILGARLYFVLFNTGYFGEHPLEIFMIWRGGLAIHGALIGGALAYFVFTRLRKIPFLLYPDIFMPGILLAQGIGRWGNFFNNEAFGGPTSLPWKLFIPEESRPAGLEDFSFFHPTFLYESLWNFLGVAVLIFLSRRIFSHSSVPGMSVPFHSGAIFFAYLAWYSVGRFFIEGLRTDSLFFGSLRAAQMMSAALFFIGIFGLYFVFKKR